MPSRAVCKPENGVDSIPLSECEQHQQEQEGPQGEQVCSMPLISLTLLLLAKSRTERKDIRGDLKREKNEKKEPSLSIHPWRKWRMGHAPRAKIWPTAAAPTSPLPHPKRSPGEDS
uniref:Uncharacterized protein n=1 Tax=Oryza glumipatula TaxID=40148 RepID=A0A0E0BJV4_9ORYZ